MNPFQLIIRSGFTLIEWLQDKLLCVVRFDRRELQDFGNCLAGLMGEAALPTSYLCIVIFWRELQSMTQALLGKPCSYAYLHSQPGHLHLEVSLSGALAETFSKPLHQDLIIRDPWLRPFFSL